MEGEDGSTSSGRMKMRWQESGMNGMSAAAGAGGLKNADVLLTNLGSTVVPSRPSRGGVGGFVLVVRMCWGFAEGVSSSVPTVPLAAAVQRSYNKMYTMDDLKWHPIQFIDLTPGASYVLGLYNSDYVREGSYNYTLKVIIPTLSHTWLRPYMSVVIGVSASLLLCLFVTLCRRILQRYGWGPFRQRAADGGAPNDADGNVFAQVAQTQTRQGGVPANVIDTFHSYEYRATRAEKEQLTKSRPVAQQPAATVAAAARGRSIVELSQRGAIGKPEATAAEAAAEAPSQSSGPDGGDSGTCAGGSASGGSGNSAASDRDEEPQCAVCLCEYEEGEVITQLPCKHEFHGTCIRKWLRTHYTCPICRVLLIPDRHEPTEPGNEDDGSARLHIPPPQSQQPQQQEQQHPLARALPQPPSGQQPWAPPQPPSNEQEMVATAAYGAPVASPSGSGGGGGALGPAMAVPLAAPPPAPAPAETAAGASRLGLLTRMGDDMPCASPQQQDVSLQPLEMPQPSSSHQLPGTNR
ncbi:hypothetical protein Vretifemale_8088 [Volvox reticuliferus]|uniref:RING-type E3 ubiquitin transferase n=1 Tax=Volvox reticuliferus TaxID=1737510 RepID=A0A8J4CA73_9CHLO|nr:hypothetical protein Vretifemale_8088 [Volvox reticuliferus]